MAVRKINESTLTAIGNAIRAKTGGSALINPEDMASEIEGIPSGTSIMDGIVVKARDANGYPTEIDYFGESISPYLFGQGSNNIVGWMYLAKVNYKSDCKSLGAFAFSFSGRDSNAPCPIPIGLTSIGTGAFSGCKYTSASFPRTLTGQLSDRLFQNSTTIVEVYAPCITSIATLGGAGNGQFYGCTGLQTVEIGSVGYGITDSRNWTFRNCTQTGLTITLYTTGSYVDTLVSNVRASATNATIVIKASENTTYNNVSYSAGDTILTSEVTS